MPQEPCSPDQLCARLKKLGFSRSQQVKLYGENLELLSDPFSDGTDFVVEARSKQTALRLVKIPKFIVKTAQAA